MSYLYLYVITTILYDVARYYSRDNAKYMFMILRVCVLKFALATENVCGNVCDKCFMLLVLALV